ncbi:MAG: BrnA antitoxin family protein [Caldilineaceae bacterium]
MKQNNITDESQTDWARLDAMEDKDIDFSEIPEVTPEMFAKAVVKRGLKPRTKSQLTLRLDSDVIEWFKEQGRGWQTQMNALLRAYMEERQAQARSQQKQK